MADWPYWANIAQPDVTLEPGAWEGEEFRNDGPALWFSDGSGGCIVEAKDKEELIATLKAILTQVEAAPDPAPDTVCKHCGRAIRWVPQRDGTMTWLHKPYDYTRADGKAWRSDQWDDACTDEHGEDLRTPSKRSRLTAWPATTDAQPQVGDVVLDLTDLEPDEEDLADVGIVTAGEVAGTYEVDGKLRLASSLRAVAPYTSEEGQS